MLFRTFTLLLGVLCLTWSAYGYAQINTSADQAYILDYETGMVLYEKNAGERMPTSSMSKVMSMLFVFKALEEGKLSLDDTLLVSEKAWRKGGSKMFVEVGKKVTVEDLIRGVIVQSGNDASIVLAEGLAGSEDNFAQQITQLAQSIGMTNSNFKNASGWPHPDHYSTAEDLAIMARHLIQNHSQYYDYYSETEFTYNNIKQANRNPLLYRDIGADGIKTGHTQAGGYGLIGSATKGGRRVILVLNGLESAKDRTEEGARLMQWALRNFENKRLFRKGEILTTLDVALGMDEEVPVTVKKDIFITVPISAVGSMQAETVYKQPQIAPVERGEQLGTLRVVIPGYGQVTEPLIAAENISELGFFRKTLAKAQYYFLQQY